METKAAIGQRGEELSVRYLRDQGFLIVARNWRAGRYEIDIIARKMGMIHLVEVKTRKAGSLISPEASITPAKASAMRRAARAYVGQSRVMDEVSIDLVAVDMFPDGSHHIRFIAEAVEFGW